jgi:flavorubredoxin
MDLRSMTERVTLLGAVDWHRRLFDSLIPLPEGTSYNAYLVRGSEKTALLDTVDPVMSDVLMTQLSSVPRVDYVVAQHAEQDHSGALLQVLERYPQARVVATPKGKGMLVDLLHLDADRVDVVVDGDRISLGDRTLEFIYTPWVHWPETMLTYLVEEKTVFTCDLFGSHYATSDIAVGDNTQAPAVVRAAKRYYAEIMMPFRKPLTRHMERLSAYEIARIAPSHGPVWDRPALILDAYAEWVSGPPHNSAVIPFVSMHGSTRALVERLVADLTTRGVRVHPFDLTVTDLGDLAMALVDAATVVIGSPTVLGGAHPQAAYAASLANALRPKALYASVVGSYGWAAGAPKALVAAMPALRLEILDPVLVQGKPRAADFDAIAVLAETIAHKQQALEL